VSLAQRFERRLEGLVGGAFARVFKGQVEPVEVGSALQREASDKRNVMGNGQVLAPNRYRVTLSTSDHERLAPWEVQLTSSLAELVQEYLDENRWSTIGDIEVYLACDDQLHTGVFGVASRMEPKAPPRRRPQDSMSLPVVPGAAVGEYAHPFSPSHHPYAPDSVGAVPAPAPLPPPPASPAPPLAHAAHAAPSAPTAAPRQGRAPSMVVDETNQRFDLRVGSNVVGRRRTLRIPGQERVDEHGLAVVLQREGLEVGRLDEAAFLGILDEGARALALEQLVKLILRQVGGSVLSTSSWLRWELQTFSL